jgi:hypothetical protein
METSVNPYESPKTRETGDGQRPRPEVYRARLAPRDVTDLLLGLFVGLPTAATLVGCGGVVFWFLSYDPLIGMMMVVSFAVSFVCLVGIRSIAIGETGLELRRVWGGSRHFRWDEIHGIRAASRLDVLRFGLFLPWRICTLSMTFRDQYRIDLHHGCLFYPPREFQSFADAIRTQLTEPSDASHPTQIVESNIQNLRASPLRRRETHVSLTKTVT